MLLSEKRTLRTKEAGLLGLTDEEPFLGGLQRSRAFLQMGEEDFRVQGLSRARDNLCLSRIRDRFWYQCGNEKREERQLGNFSKAQVWKCLFGF